MKLERKLSYCITGKNTPAKSNMNLVIICRRPESQKCHWGIHSLMHNMPSVIHIVGLDY